MKKQNGFTLIELVVVIIILGILAVVAAPKFINLSDDADQAVVDGTAGAMKSAVSMVQAKAKAQSKLDGQTVQVGSDASELVTVNGEGFPKFAAVAGDDEMTTLSYVLDVPKGYAVEVTADTGDAKISKTARNRTCSVNYVAATGAVTAACVPAV